MLNLLRTFFPGKTDASQRALPADLAQTPAPAIVIDGAAPLRIEQYIGMHEGFPIMDWVSLNFWIDELPQASLQAQAWAEVERAWLLHFRKALGPHFRLVESRKVALLSGLDEHLARTTLDYMERTLRRVATTLDGIAQVPPWGKDILIVFDDEESYYRYVSYYYPDPGEYARSGGMHINDGCSHFVSVRSDLQTIEPVIAHEMAHGILGHLPLPLWLNEGIAVNTEQRLAGVRASDYTPQELRQKHLQFWGEAQLQQFWSGESFNRIDDGNLLSYDLARIIVEHLARDWDSFKRFVLAADHADGGAAAARQELGLDLGDLVCSLLEKKPSGAWAPRPQAWAEA
jgi:hypothetical protein